MFPPRSWKLVVAIHRNEFHHGLNREVSSNGAASRKTRWEKRFVQAHVEKTFAHEAYTPLGKLHPFLGMLISLRCHFLNGHSMWDLSFLTRNPTGASCIGRWSQLLDHQGSPHFNHFKIYSSVALRAFTLLCDHHHHPSPYFFFIISDWNSVHIKEKPSVPPFPQSLEPIIYSLSLWIWLF